MEQPRLLVAAPLLDLSVVKRDGPVPFARALALAALVGTG